MMVRTCQILALVLFGQIGFLTPSGHDTICSFFHDFVLDLVLGAHAATDTPDNNKDCHYSHTPKDVDKQQISWLVN